MKRLLLVLVAVMVLVPFVFATTDFQEYGDMSWITTPGSGNVLTWVGSTTGANSYIKNTVAGGGSFYLQNANPYPFTYLAFNYVAGSAANPQVRLADNTNTSMYALDIAATGRWEVNIVGSTAYVYKNGILQATSGVLAQNPSYFQLGGWLAFPSDRISVDDITFGDADDKTILGMPGRDLYYLKKDIVNPSASGFYNSTTNALISSATFTSTFSRSNLTGEALVNQPIYLIDRDTGTVYETENTGTASTGTVTWHMANLTTSAPYGWYQTKLGTTLSDTIPYIANGANIYFDRSEYSAGDTATITYLIDAGYYDTSTYAYSIKIVDVYGSVIDSQNIATASGSVTYTWTADNTQGVYYAEIIGTPNAGGSDVLYNYDYATLSAYFDVTGYVHDAETERPISGALVNASQGSIMSNATSGYDGNYTVSGFLSGVLFGMNTSATSHQPYWNNFTPITSHTLHINITLVPSSPTKTDITLGGVCRDTTYGRPIPACSVDIWNVTDGQYWTKVANSVGFYNKTMLLENDLYNIEGMKTRYKNSTIYNKTVVRA